MKDDAWPWERKTKPLGILNFPSSKQRAFDLQLLKFHFPDIRDLLQTERRIGLWEGGALLGGSIKWFGKEGKGKESKRFN